MCNFAVALNVHAYAKDMKYAIIAAGRGSRLRKEGVNMPKPLVEINGEKLIDRLIRIFISNGATEILVICNDLYPEVINHLTLLEQQGLPVKHIVKNTESSMHSLQEIVQRLQNDKFILTTIDTVFSERMFRQFVKAFCNSTSDGMMAVTDFCDDERPLYVLTEDIDNTQLPIIKGFHDDKPTCADCETIYISAGVYGLTSAAVSILEQCVSKGMSRMRNFQRALITNGLLLNAYPLGMVIDIDHSSDIKIAQRFIHPRHLLGIYRAQFFSPNCIEKDRRIMDAISKEAKRKGYDIELISEEFLQESGILPEADIYISMARSTEVLNMLSNVICINSVKGIHACNRRSYVTQVDNPPLWLKRADRCAEQKDDVLYCNTTTDLTKAINAFRSRGITTYIQQRHYDGDLIKFYGVNGTSFFNWYYPSEKGVSKFGIESDKGTPNHYPFSDAELHSKAGFLSTTLGVSVYGGDAIISHQGDVHIIDFNDFPSFSPCIEEAAEAVVSIIQDKLMSPEDTI